MLGSIPDKVKTVGEVFTDEYYGIAAAKGNEDIVAKINTAIAALEAEGKFEELIAQVAVGKPCHPLGRKKNPDISGTGRPLPGGDVVRARRG